MAALREWRTKGRFADLVISKLLAKTKLTTLNRAFALEIFYGVLRNLTLIDSWIGYLRPSGLDLGLRDILRIGFYQLFFLKTPHYAAVYVTVQLAPKRRRAVINGMLRTAIRQQDEMLTRAEAQPFLCESVPSAISGRTLAAAFWR